ncbi:MAG: hypothetical protein IPM15_01335 [Betaproteobacteria bacterium]|nr:hypothetical protein [Betaproteobacteria bacterium]MCC6250332.1 hypothetical protein [Rubrivivax sp.]MCL4695652.1 hypothetical protein [Burkholderiaceae bacterium]
MPAERYRIGARRSAMPGTKTMRSPQRGRVPLAAIILITLGALFLLSNLGLIPHIGPLIAKWWPLILIVVGVALLWRRK